MPRSARAGLAFLLLVAVSWALVRDVAYLRTIPIDDIFGYDCYARAFWRGPAAVVDEPRLHLCGNWAFAFWVAPPRAFHTFPREYPAPALAVFSLPLLVPTAPYNLTFMAMLAALVVGVTAALLWRELFLCAVALDLYVLVGGWATGLARYDLIPAALTLAALALAERSRWRCTYLVLALATVLKGYPALLVPIVAVHQWRMSGQHRRQWCVCSVAYRLSPIACCVGLFGLAVLAAFLPFALADPARVRAPLGYNLARPPQIESLPASALWLAGRLGVGRPVQAVLAFHSLDVTGPLAGPVVRLSTVALAVGVLLACRRAWRGNDTLGRSFVLTVLVALVTSKLFSPQYMLWLFPLVAYVEGLRLRWVVFAVLTVTIYPNAYGFHTSLVTLPDQPTFMAAILARNAMLLVLTVVYLGGHVERRWPGAVAERAGMPGLGRVDRRGGQRWLPGAKRRQLLVRWVCRRSFMAPMVCSNQKETDEASGIQG